MFVVTLVNYWADGVVPEAALRESDTCFWPFSSGKTGNQLTISSYHFPGTLPWRVPLANHHLRMAGIHRIPGQDVLVHFRYSHLSSCDRGYVRHGSTWTDLPMFKNGFGVTSYPSQINMFFVLN